MVRLVANQLRSTISAQPCGNGRPVLVIPGFLAGDFTTSLLRRSLAAADFRPFGWGLGLNKGASKGRLEAAIRRLREIARQEERPVTILGWSLGGIYAREIAKRSPEVSESVITLGSPFSGDLRANNAWRLYELINDHRVDALPFPAEINVKPPVHTIALWSPIDGIVAPASARGSPTEADEAIEIRSSHMGFGSDPEVIARVIEVLCQTRDC